jgi:hypothetical protein
MDARPGGPAAKISPARKGWGAISKRLERRRRGTKPGPSSTYVIRSGTEGSEFAPVKRRKLEVIRLGHVRCAHHCATPDFLPRTQVRAGPGLVPRLRRSNLFGIDPQPFRAGLILAAGPLGLASMAILHCHFLP